MCAKWQVTGGERALEGGQSPESASNAVPGVEESGAAGGGRVTFNDGVGEGTVAIIVMQNAFRKARLLPDQRPTH